MCSPISRSDLQILLREADIAARRLSRHLWLSHDDLADLRQELLVDLLARLSGFDPERGSLGAFAGVVMANRATRLAQRVLGHRRMFGIVPVSLDEILPNGDGTTRGDLISEEQSLAAIQGHWVNPVAEVERRIDLERGLGTLDEKGRRLAAELSRESAHRLAQDGLGSRSELYRQTHEIRLSLLAAGIGAA